MGFCDHRGFWLLCPRVIILSPISSEIYGKFVSNIHVQTVLLFRIRVVIDNTVNTPPGLNFWPEGLWTKGRVVSTHNQNGGIGASLGGYTLTVAEKIGLEIRPRGCVVCCHACANFNASVRTTHVPYPLRTDDTISHGINALLQYETFWGPRNATTNKWSAAFNRLLV